MTGERGGAPSRPGGGGRRAPRPLGPLERAVLEALWAHGERDVQGVHAAVGAPRGLAKNTVQSTLERLFRKGLLERRKRGRAFAYRARVTRAEWAEAALAGLLETLPGADAELLLAPLVDLAERAGEETLAELERRVRARRRARERGG